MCGRFSLNCNSSTLEERFAARFPERERWQPRSNMAPSQSIPVVVLENGQLQIVMMKWGFIPSWYKGGKALTTTKNVKSVKAMINARAEGIEEKPFFRDSVKRRRCLVPITSFFEWKESQPYKIYVRDEPVLAIAGVWDVLPMIDGNGGAAQGERCGVALVTTAPNEFMINLHKRMPRLLSRSEEREWLQALTSSGAAALLRREDGGFPAKLFAAEEAILRAE